MDASTRPVFIIGCPRSGTTWLYHILLSAGRFAIYRSETQIYSRFAPCFGNFSSPERRAEFLFQWLDSEYFLRSGLDAKSFYAKAMEFGSSPGAMLRLFMKEICTYQLASRWAECTPENALHLRRIKRDFPEALFIHIVRDGRDVALSLARQRFLRPFPWHRAKPELSAGAYWDWVIKTIDRESRCFPRDMLTLKYEDLATNIQDALERVSAFVGQRLDINRVLRHPIGSVSKPNSSFTEHASADSINVGRWKTGYSASLLNELEAAIANTLLEYEYPPAITAGSMFRGFYRALYAARFQASLALKTRTFLGRFADHGLVTLSANEHTGDPTLRPGAYLSRIREIVSG